MANIELENSALEELIFNFYKGNLNFSLTFDDVQNMDWHWQQAFLDATVNSILLKKYPVSSQFSKLFLKKLLEYLEPYQEVHDDIYAQLCSAMKESSRDGFCYRHYVIGKCLDYIVTIKETRNMVVNGTTGMKTWEAALMISDWALSHKDVFANKSVLELGAGVGFAGITIGKMCNIKSLTLTDCHSEVLRTIGENIEINFPHFKQEINQNTTLFRDSAKSIGVMPLDWNNVEHLREEMVPDVIIGADIVYDPLILEPLCKVLQNFSNKNHNLEIYIASVIRNEETFDLFLITLDTMNFAYEKIEMVKSVYIDWDENIQRCLLKIKLK